MLSRHLTVKHECTLNTIRESAKEKKCVWDGGEACVWEGGSGVEGEGKESVILH